MRFSFAVAHDNENKGQRAVVFLFVPTVGSCLQWNSRNILLDETSSVSKFYSQFYQFMHDNFVNFRHEPNKQFGNFLGENRSPLNSADQTAQLLEGNVWSMLNVSYLLKQNH